MTLVMVSVPDLRLLEELRQLYLTDAKLQDLLQRGKEGKLNDNYSCRDDLLYCKNRLYVANNRAFKRKLLELLQTVLVGETWAMRKQYTRL